MHKSLHHLGAQWPFGHAITDRLAKPRETASHLMIQARDAARSPRARADRCADGEVHGNLVRAAQRASASARLPAIRPVSMSDSTITDVRTVAELERYFPLSDLAGQADIDKTSDLQSRGRCSCPAAVSSRVEMSMT